MAKRFLITVALLAALSGLSGAARADSAHDYQLHCSGCHQTDGSGAPHFGVPSFVGSLGHFLRLPEGRAFLVQVPGTANSPLDDRHTAALLNWLVFAVSREAVPADFQPYTEAEVAVLRRQRVHDVPAARAGIVARLASQGYPVQ